jgi:hypothetical protein
MSDDRNSDGGSVTEGLRKENEKEEKITQNSPEASTGDVDATWDQADTAGTELPGGGNETPDEGSVDGIGKATGESYEEGEPLDPTKKE